MTETGALQPGEKVGLASDHAGYRMKEAIKKHLAGRGINVIDFGAGDETSCDYPDYAVRAATSVAAGESRFGVLVCKTGIGMSIAANKVPGVRAALCKDSEAARLSREHNNANMLALDGRTEPGAALGIVDTWLKTNFSGGRHAPRINKIDEIERKFCSAPRLG